MLEHHPATGGGGAPQEAPESLGLGESADPAAVDGFQQSIQRLRGTTDA